MNEIRFTVYGKPETAGSKRAFPFKKKNGKLGVAVSDDNPKGKDWRIALVAAARDVYRGPLLAGALELDVTFFLTRPLGHYGSGKNAMQTKPSAPKYPVVTPDTTKLLRAVEDAFKGILWRDDSQIVEQHARKRYAGYTESPRVHILVRSIEP